MARMGNVVSYVDGNIEGPLRVSDLAKIARLSGAHFSRTFTKALGMPPAQYVGLRRPAVAMTLMRTTNEKLSAIALCSGHADQSHLSRAFRRVIGVPPGRWRRSMI